MWQPADANAYATSMWNHMFSLTLPLAEKIHAPGHCVLRSSLSCCASLESGELRQLNPFDLVVLLSVSNTVQNAINGMIIPSPGGLIGAVRTFRRQLPGGALYVPPPGAG
jgi:hypothetical protein